MDNKFQPPVEIVEVETMQNKEVINEDLRPNQIRIRITGSDRLRGADASYLKYHFRYDEENPKNVFENQFDIHRRDP